MEAPIENVDGQIVETHSFQHHIEHRINWSHVGLALVSLAALYVLFWDRDEGKSEGSTGETGGVTNR